MTVQDIRNDYKKLNKLLDIEIKGKTFYFEEYVKFLENSLIKYIGNDFTVDETGFLHYKKELK
jgi:hypothetical protein